MSYKDIRIYSCDTKFAELNLIDQLHTLF